MGNLLLILFVTLLVCKCLFAHSRIWATQRVSQVQSLGSKEEVGTLTSVLMLSMNGCYFHYTFFVTGVDKL